MARHQFAVIVFCDTVEQAERVMSERLGHDADYGFDYKLAWVQREQEELPTSLLEAMEEWVSASERTRALRERIVEITDREPSAVLDGMRKLFG